MGTKFYGGKITAPLFRECYSVQNLLPAANMKSGWSRAGAATPVAFADGCYSISLTGTESTPEVCLTTTDTIPLNNAHIYYARVYGRQDTVCGSAGFYWPIAEPSLRDGIPIQAAGAWRMYSTRNHRQSFDNGSYPFRLDFNNGYTAGSIAYCCPMLVDLTEAFGAGKEPSKEWCDANIPFAESSVDLPVDKSVSVSAAELRAKSLTEFGQEDIIVKSGVSISAQGLAAPEFEEI